MKWKLDAIKHARDEFPREACGLVVAGGALVRYRPCRNIAAGADHFAIAPRELAAAEDAGDVVGVFHSHPGASPEPSDADRAGCLQSGLPWHILGLPSGEWRAIEPGRDVPPLVGREFDHGRLDCYTLIRDWYLVERGVVLPEFPRSDEWWSHGGNLYTEGYPLAGFVPAPGSLLSQGDVILMKIRSPVPNHAAIYLGGDMILHHLCHRLSCREHYRDLYRNTTTHVLRYAP